MPNKYKKNKVKPRGVSNRNRGLDWIRANASDGVFYFADDDNTYDLQIFHEVIVADCSMCSTANNSESVQFPIADEVYEKGVDVASWFSNQIWIEQSNRTKG